MRTTEIAKQLAEENEILVEAQQAAATAAGKLSTDPRNQKHRIAVVAAQQAVAEIQVGIDALNAAMDEAKKYDGSKEAQAVRDRRTKAAKHVAACHEQVAEAAKAVDKALASLLKCAQNWRAMRVAATKATYDYLELTEIEDSVRSNYSFVLTNSPNEISRAFALGLYRAVRAAGSVDFQDMIVFNTFDVSDSTDSGGVMGQVSPSLVENAVATRVAHVKELLTELEAKHGC
jgi:hypothetical protein